MVGVIIGIMYVALRILLGSKMIIWIKPVLAKNTSFSGIAAILEIQDSIYATKRREK